MLRRRPLRERRIRPRVPAHIREDRTRFSNQLAGLPGIARAAMKSFLSVDCPTTSATSGVLPSEQSGRGLPSAGIVRPTLPLEKHMCSFPGTPRQHDGDASMRPICKPYKVSRQRETDVQVSHEAAARSAGRGSCAWSCCAQTPPGWTSCAAPRHVASERIRGRGLSPRGRNWHDQGGTSSSCTWGDQHCRRRHSRSTVPQWIPTTRTLHLLAGQTRRARRSG